MTLSVILGATGLLLGTALLSLLVSRFDRAALAIGTAGSVAACLLGGAASVLATLRGEDLTRAYDWPLAVGGLELGLDGLSSFFLLCIFLVAGLASVYGAGYLSGYLGKRRLAPALAFFNLLVAAMALVVLARDAVVFLVAWELMSVASFFLVTFEHERDDVCRAGMTYLIASQAGTVFLMLAFGLLWGWANTTSFSGFAAGPLPSSLATAVFLSSLLGFGTKAGFWPVHVWLPDAHPAAPSHVSALMSGVMIKIGIYGLLRMLGFLGAPPMWWGALVVGIGLVSGIIGVVHALGQRDLKRLLAYSSVENVGIIALGVGIGLLGQATGKPELAFLGFAGALLHVLNHGLFKGLLFQCAGSVLHATGTGELDKLGGLSRKMPTTALAFLAGSVAISGLPPFNGFIGEWLIFLGSFRTAGQLGAAAVCAVSVIAGLALIGGLAAGCFVSALGMAFLGEPRSDAVQRAHEGPASMRGAMIAGAVCCAAIGLFPQAALLLVRAPAADLSGAVPASISLGPLAELSRAGLLLVGIALLLALLRRLLLARREVREDRTWGCGYGAPTPRMQYTASSFAEPLLAPFAPLLRKHLRIERPAGPFPSGAHYEEHLGDMAGEQLLVPAARRLVGTLGRLRVLQHGQLHLYLVYILVTLLGLLAWQLAIS